MADVKLTPDEISALLRAIETERLYDKKTPKALLTATDKLRNARRKKWVELTANSGRRSA